MGLARGGQIDLLMKALMWRRLSAVGKVVRVPRTGVNLTVYGDMMRNYFCCEETVSVAVCIAPLPRCLPLLQGQALVNTREF